MRVRRGLLRRGRRLLVRRGLLVRVLLRRLGVLGCLLRGWLRRLLRSWLVLFSKPLLGCRLLGDVLLASLVLRRGLLVCVLLGCLLLRGVLLGRLVLASFVLRRGQLVRVLLLGCGLLVRVLLLGCRLLRGVLLGRLALAGLVFRRGLLWGSGLGLVGLGGRLLGSGLLGCGLWNRLLLVGRPLARGCVVHTCITLVRSGAHAVASTPFRGSIPHAVVFTGVAVVPDGRRRTEVRRTRGGLGWAGGQIGGGALELGAVSVRTRRRRGPVAGGRWLGHRDRERGSEVVARVEPGSRRLRLAPQSLR
ncbi:hypothetical protein [Kribbella sp. NPDC004875]|uniref:hypothetical protein n=1 Tax=Kribbella sp. NPDC004875 TaxID=3364107 RepID=UPI0036834D6A